MRAELTSGLESAGRLGRLAVTGLQGPRAHVPPSPCVLERLSCASDNEVNKAVALIAVQSLLQQLKPARIAPLPPQP